MKDISDATWNASGKDKNTGANANPAVPINTSSKLLASVIGSTQNQAAGANTSVAANKNTDIGGIEKLKEQINSITNTKFREEYLECILKEAIEVTSIQLDLKPYVFELIEKELSEFIKDLKQLTDHLKMQVGDKAKKYKKKIEH